MYVLNYWHTVSDYAEWKKIFDSDPLGREASGVRRVSIERPVDDEHTVIGSSSSTAWARPRPSPAGSRRCGRVPPAQRSRMRASASPRSWCSRSSARERTRKVA